MRRLDFLRRLRDERKLELVEPSEDIAASYIIKSSNALHAADILAHASLFEESISMSYYAMYDCIVALMCKCGIKCENHAASIIVLEVVFCEPALSKLISDVKAKRIDAQYYVDFKACMADAEALLGEAQKFTIKIRTIIGEMNNDKMREARASFSEMVG